MYWASLNLTWRKASLGEEDSIFLNKKFSKNVFIDWNCFSEVRYVAHGPLVSTYYHIRILYKLTHIKTHPAFMFLCTLYNQARNWLFNELLIMEQIHTLTTTVYTFETKYYSNPYANNMSFWYTTACTSEIQAGLTKMLYHLLIFSDILECKLFILF